MSFLETSLETRACIHLRRAGANPVKRGQNGEPDREVLWGNGLHFWIEFKRDDLEYRLRKSQRVFIKYLRAIGDTVHVVGSFDDIAAIIETWTLIHGPATAKRDKAFQ